MSVIDEHLSKIEDASRRQALEHVRDIMRAELPGADEVISYGIPAFKYKGKAVGGFNNFAKHLSYFPWGSGAMKEFADELKQFEQTKSSIHFTPEHMISDALLKKLIAFKVAEIEALQK